MNSWRVSEQHIGFR